MQYREACFSQGEVAAGRSDRNPAAAAVGICVAFSIHWLRLVLSHNRQLPRDRLAKMKRDSGGIDLLMQKIYMDRWSLSEANEADQMLFRLRGLKRLDPLISFRAFSCERLVSTLTLTQGGFLYEFTFNSPVSGSTASHAVAFYRTSVGFEGFILFFDPNFGEFHVLPEDFLNFWWRHTAVCYSSPISHVLVPAEISDKDHLSG